MNNAKTESPSAGAESKPRVSEDDNRLPLVRMGAYSLTPREWEPCLPPFAATCRHTIHAFRTDSRWEV